MQCEYVESAKKVLKMKTKEQWKSCRLVCEMKQCAVLKTRRAEFCTAYHSAVHRKLLLSRRPGKPPTRQDVEVNVEYGLAGPCAIIDDHPVSLRVQTLIVSDFLCGQEKVPNKIFIGCGHAMNLGNMFLWNNEEMDGRLRVHIFKGGHEMVFIHGF